MFRALAVALVLLTSSAHADVSQTGLRNPQQIGEATFRWLGLPLYDATLYTPDGAQFSWSNDVALRLVYAQSISQSALVRASVSELERIEGANSDQSDIGTKLNGCFRDVTSGDEFIAASRGSDTLEFWFNGQKTCAIQHSALAQRFLSIWLSDNSRSPAQSRRLRGGS